MLLDPVEDINNPALHEEELRKMKNCRELVEVGLHRIMKVHSPHSNNTHCPNNEDTDILNRIKAIAWFSTQQIADCYVVGNYAGAGLLRAFAIHPDERHKVIVMLDGYFPFNTFTELTRNAMLDWAKREDLSRNWNNILMPFSRAVFNLKKFCGERLWTNNSYRAYPSEEEIYRNEYRATVRAFDRIPLSIEAELCISRQAMEDSWYFQEEIKSGRMKGHVHDVDMDKTSNDTLRQIDKDLRGTVHTEIAWRLFYKELGVNCVGSVNELTKMIEHVTE